MKDKNTIIELRNVCKTYQMGKVLVKALRGVDLKIKRGKIISIVGPSGSGKSTMMNLIGCLDIPTCGHIYLEHQDIAKMSESDLAEIRGKKIGFVFQQFNLMNTLSAKKNVMLPMIFQGYPEDERKKRADNLLHMVGLEHRKKHKPTEMSGGEQQRVAIARSLANDPDVLLADEPTGNLDTKTGEQILGILKKIHKEDKKTIIMVTHDMDLARKAQKTIKIRDGKIV